MRRDVRRASPSARSTEILRHSAAFARGSPATPMPAHRGASPYPWRRLGSALAAVEEKGLAAKSSIVARQPKRVIVRSKEVGHSIPATDWPDEIKATAVPRRRSNQRLI